MTRRLAEAVAAEGIEKLRDRLTLALCRSEYPQKRCEECRREHLPCYVRNEERARVVLNELLRDTL